MSYEERVRIIEKIFRGNDDWLKNEYWSYVEGGKNIIDDVLPYYNEGYFGG